MNFWVFGFCGIALFCLYDPFIRIWAGRDMVFGNIWCVFVIVLDFVTAGLQQTVITHKDACGLFWEGKWRPVASGLLNLVLSLLAVKPFGVVGVIGATTVSRMLTTWWFDPYLVFKHAFKTSPKPYYIRYIKRLLFISAVCAVNFGMCFGADYLIKLYVTGKSYYVVTFIPQLLITLVFPNICFWLISRKTPEYISLLFSISSLLGKKLAKKSKKIASVCKSIDKRYYAMREQGRII